MKRLLLIAAMIFVAYSAYPQKEKLTRQQKKDAKEAALALELDSLIMNRSFDFHSTLYQETYEKGRRTVVNGGIEFYPRYCDVHLNRPKLDLRDPDPEAEIEKEHRRFELERTVSGFESEKIYPSGYAVRRTDEGWIIVFNLYGPGINGNDYYDGRNQLFRFELNIDKAANAVLNITTGFNEHKYPHIYKGKVTKNTKN